MKIAFNPSTVAALTTPPNNKDITFDLRGRNIFARGVKFLGTDTWRDIKINNVSIGSNILDLRNGSNTTLTNTNGVVTINSTWRPVVDNLTSDSTTSSLSANLGRILKALIDGKSNSGHTHDDRYLKLTGGTMTGNIILSPKTTIIKPLRPTSNYDSIVSWSVDGETKQYGREIGLHNTGGSDSTGSIAIVPYKTDTAPWLGTVGLFIAKNTLKLDNKPIAFKSDIPSSLKNPYSLTLLANGTTLATYDGSVSKIVNLTYDNVGAAAKNHTHNSLEPWASYSYITGDSHATALKSIFDKNKTSIPRNKFISMLSRAYDNTSYYMGYFIRNYDNNPYGGFFVAHYDTAYYIGIANGSFTQHRLVYSTDIPNSLKNPHALTISLNGTSLGPYDGSAAKNINITPGSIGAATSGHNHDDRYLKLTGGTMQLGEGLKFHADDNYFGTYADARIISLLDGNDTVCDGGLIIDERATLNGKEYVTELLRIRDSEFKWKGSNILHSGNSHINGNTITINGSSLTVSKSDHTHAYLPLSGGTMTGNIAFSNSSYLLWNNGSYHLRIFLTDDSTADTAVFTFLQSSDSGVNWSNLMTIRDNGKVIANTFVGALLGNASTATKLTSSAGNVALPIYFSDGKPVACTASSIFSNLSNSGNNISVTVAGQNRTLTVGYATSAGYANGIANKGLLDSQEKIDNFITANRFEYAIFKTTESNNVGFASNDGMILSIPWISTTYGAQIAFDDVHAATVKVRCKNPSWGNWYTLLHSGNYNSYSPKLDGTGASGTWDINITGNANTVDGVHVTWYGALTSTSHLVAWEADGSALRDINPAHVTVGNSDKVDGFHATSGNNKPWGTIPAITTSGWMDIGKQLEFHYDNTTGSDYSTILRCTGNYSNIIDLPSISGTLALTSQIPNVTNYYWANIKISDTSNSNTAPIFGSAIINTRLSIAPSTLTKTSPTSLQLVINGPYLDDSVTPGLKDWPGIGFHMPGRTWGSLIFNGNITAINSDYNGYVNYYGAGFRKNGSSDSYVLLGGGGHKALSDFMSSTVKYALSDTIGGKALLAYKLYYSTSLKDLASIDNFHEAYTLKCALWNGNLEGMGSSFPGTPNGIILSGGWTDTKYGFQLAIDDDPNYFIALRQRNNSTWYTWKRIPMGDGTGASGTWGINITGSAGSVAWGNITGKPSSFTPTSHNHSFTLGATTITTGETRTAINGPFAICTDASAGKAFSIYRDGANEGVKHWVDDTIYHIEYTNDEDVSSIAIRLIDTDSERATNKGANAKDVTVYLDCYRNFYPSSNNTGSIGISDRKWANMYATTFHGSLDGNATTATNSDKLDGLDSTKFLRQVVVPNNTENDFNTFSNMTLTGRVDPTTGASLKNAPWSGSGPAGGYGVLTYLFNGWDYGTQMAWEYGSNRIYIRNRHWGGSGVGTVWRTSWDTLALTSDNVASATKLQTPRLLWGQSFDGTRDISGSIRGTYFHIEDRASNPYFKFIDSSNQIGYFQLLPQNKGVAIGSTESKSLIVNPSGNVGIGTTNLSYKLSVGGDIGTEGNIYISHNTNNNMNYNTSNPRIVFSENGNLAVGLVYTDYDSYRASKGLKVMDVDNNDTSNVWLEVLGYNYSSGYVKNGSNSSYVLLGDGGHKLESALNVSNADLLDGQHGSRYTRALGSPNYITINVGGDANTYYPVVISSISDYYPMLFVNISRVYNETAPNTWNTSTHKGGLTLTLLWNGSRFWDGNSSGYACYCVYKNETYSTMVGGLGNATGGKVVWLRGGGAAYHIHSMNGTSTSVTVYTSTYTDSANQSFSPRTTPEVISVRWPGIAQGADYATSASNADTATKVIVNLNTTNDANYPLVWSNLANSSTITENQLYKSWSDLYYNPKNKRLTVGGSVVASSFVKRGGTSLQLLRADGGIATFNWSGQSGLPTWLWGGNNEHSYYVYNPSNFRVAYATSSGNADTLDGVHLSGIFTAFGNNNHNITATIGGVTKEFLVNWATDSDKLDGYHASNLLTSVTNTNNGISVTVGGTTKSVSNISVNYAASAGSASSATQATNLTPENTPHYFRDPYNSAWRGGMYWGSAGNESMSFVAVNSGTRFQFVGGSDIANWTSSTWQSVTPYLTIYSSGIVTSGSVTATNGFIKSGSSDSYVLLGGGGHKAESSLRVEYATSAGSVDTALYLRSLGNLNCQTGRTLNYGDVYTYNTYDGNTGSPTTYTSVIGFGRGIAGTVEIAGGWDNTNLYWRSLRDCCEDWHSWRTVLDSSNYTEFINNYYWANVKISTSSSTTTSPTVSNLTATSSIRMGNIYLLNTNEINSASGIHLNYQNSGNISLCYGGGKVGIGTTSPTYKLDVNGLIRASGFHHSSMNSDNYMLLAGGGYKSFGGDSSHPVFLGYLNLDHGSDGTVSSSFSCLGYTVPFTYTRGGNYCKISIPDTTHQAFYIKAATASVNYSGGGMDTWTGNHRGAGAWWLHCYAPSSNEVRVKGFHLKDTNNDSWWGGNPLWSDRSGVNRITVCIFGYVTFR